jgi:hypothetical protein
MRIGHHILLALRGSLRGNSLQACSNTTPSGFGSSPRMQQGQHMHATCVLGTTFPRALHGSLRGHSLQACSVAASKIYLL